VLISNTEMLIEIKVTIENLIGQLYDEKKIVEVIRWDNREYRNPWLLTYYAALIDDRLISQMHFSPDFGTLRPATREQFDRAIYINQDSPNEFKNGYERSVIALAPCDKIAITHAFELLSQNFL
jgi:hypothetical protein